MQVVIHFNGLALHSIMYEKDKKQEMTSIIDVILKLYDR
jgi:hypothetical protein